MPFQVLDLGVRDYEEVWRFQKALVRQRISEEIPDTLILVEHLPVFTVGRAAQGDHPTQIGDIPCVKVERGGEITFHGPGQLVGYPILGVRGRDVHRFLRELEELLIRTLGDFGIRAERRVGLTGVWVGAKKIASIGVALRRWVSYHGFALNVSVDLRYFHMIRPCGLNSKVITSMSEQLSRPISLAEVKPHLLERWREIFRNEDHTTSVASVTPKY